MSGLAHAAQVAAEQTVGQVLGNVRSIRPRRDVDVDPNAELRTVALDAYAWTLVLLSLRDSGVAVAAELADSIEARLRVQ